jgi:septum formation protein
MIVLASASAARRALLDQAGIRAEIRPAAVDEHHIRVAMRAEGTSARDCALLLAQTKAARVSVTDSDDLVIGADQILDLDGRWFDKPADVDTAKDQIRALRGRTHTLQTAAVCYRGGRQIWSHVEAPRLIMRNVSEDFLADYATREGEALLGSVGAYRLEGLGAQLFERVDGDLFSVLGLPLLPLLGFLRQHGEIRE